MQLIIDSGATKALWVAVETGEEVQRVHTPGISPYYLSDEQIAVYASQVRDQLNDAPTAIHFYGTGLKAPEGRQRLKRLLGQCFNKAADIQVATDILGAARAACGHRAGMAAILGTGSNACCFDGENVTDTIGGLGYILGDEGSGAALGKALLSAFLNRQLPKGLTRAFEAEYQTGRDEILRAVYQGETPSRYLASFAPFLHERQEHPFIAELLRNEFRRFCQNNLFALKGCRELPVHFIGSVALHFRQHVEAALEEESLQAGSFQGDPMAGLVGYHAVKK